MLKNYIVVIGTSAGGIKPLKKLLSMLPKNFPGPILIVLHLSPYSVSHLAKILQRGSELRIVNPHQGQKLEAGYVYVAPPNVHMVIEDEMIKLHQGPKVNHCRPAIDPLFFSAAACHGSCIVGIVLSGLLDDGSAGLLEIKRQRGVTIVQDLSEAEYPDMPLNALKNAEPKYTLTVKEISRLLIELVNTSIPDKTTISASNLLLSELKMNEVTHSSKEEDMNEIGKPSVFSCPECHGVLWEIKDDEIVRYRCRIGHAFGLESLFKNMDEAIEAALWTAVRALEEKQNLIEKYKETEKNKFANLSFEKSEYVKDQIDMLRNILDHAKE